MLGMRVVSLEIRGPGGVRNINLDHPLVAVYGPTNTGKTFLADAISFCLGNNISWTRSLRARVTQCALRIRIGSTEHTLTRALTHEDPKIRRGSTSALDAIHPMEHDNSFYPAFPDWILTETGLKDVIDPDEIAALGGSATRLSFTDLWTYLYRTQGDLDRQVALQAGGKQGAKTKALFELLFGLSTTKMRLLNEQIREANKDARALDKKLKNIRSFFQDTRTSPEAATAEYKRTDGELQQVTAMLEQAVKEMDEWEEVRADLLKRYTDAQRAQADAAAHHTVSTQPRPASSSWIHHACPACGKGIPPGRADTSTCELCLQARLHGPRADARAPSTPSEPAPTTANDELARATSALDRASEALGAHEAEKPAETAGLRVLEARRATYRERLTRLSTQVKQERMLAELVEAVTSARGEIKRLTDELEHVRRRNTDRETVLRELGKHFYAEVSGIELPWLDGSGTIDDGSYLPIIGGQRFEQLSSGTKGAVNIAYSLALLAYSVRGTSVAEDGPYLPRFLIVDGIRKNIGANPADRGLADRLYHRAHVTALRLMERGEGQIIVLDNDAPPKELVRSGVVRLVPLSYDDPLIPGVSHTDTGENPNA